MMKIPTVGWTGICHRCGHYVLPEAGLKICTCLIVPVQRLRIQAALLKVARRQHFVDSLETIKSEISRLKSEIKQYVSEVKFLNREWGVKS